MANPSLKNPGVWGIDLGQCALKAIRLEEVDGQLRATAFDYIEHPKILSQPDADPDQLTREALQKFLSRNDLKGDTVAISVPGQSGLARFVKLPPVDEKKIPDIVRFEAKQQIPFPLEEVVWAFQRLGTGTVADNFVLDAEVGLFAMKRDMVNRYLQHFKDVNVEVHVVQMAPLALCNFLAHDLLGKGARSETGGEDDEGGGGDKNCVVALDIGADNSNLVITDGERIIWQRPIPLGGNHFTRALTKDLKLTFAKAEHLKRNAVKSPDLKKILAALKPVLNDFVSEVQRSLGYFTNTHRDANIQYMMGLGNAFRLPGLQKYLQEKLQLEVRKLQKIQRLEGDEAVTVAPQYVENVLSFGVAHGLALQGLQATRLHTNLLPPEIAKERFVRAKKPWAVAAAAVLLLLAPPLLVGYAASYSAWSNKRVAEATEKLNKAVETANKDVSDYKAALDDAEQATRKVKAMAGGIDERLNWMHLNAFVNEALPVPGDPRRLAQPTRSGFDAYTLYWSLDKSKASKEEGIKHFPGAQAWKDYLELAEMRALLFASDEKFEKLKLQRPGLKRPTTEEIQKKEDFVKKNLIKVHIEGIAALYCDDLPKEYFAKLAPETAAARDTTSYKLIGLSPEEAKSVREKKDTLPKAGWVVEIRGFTYHQDYAKFVEYTIVENLRELTEPDNRTLSVSIFPKEVKGAFRIEEAGDASKKSEKSRASHVQLYEYFIDPIAAPGEFTLIKRSKLPELLGMSGAAGGGGFGEKPGVTTPKGSQGKGEDAMPTETATKEGKDRGSWRPPSGTLAADSLGGGAGGNPYGGGPGAPLMSGGKGSGPRFGEASPGSPGSANPLPAGAVRRVPRTEFVILFIWQEPLPIEATPSQ